MNVHRFKMRNNNTATLYKHMRKLGVKHFTIVLIEYYSCNNKDQLLRRERYIFDLHNKNILLNINRPHTSFVEKRQQQVKYSSTWNIKNELHYLQNQKIYQQRYYQFNKLMQELPFYKVKCFISF